MAANQLLTGQTWGFFPNAPTFLTLQINAAATWLALGFVSPASAKTINSVMIYVSAVTGSLLATDVTASLCSDATAGGTPLMPAIETQPASGAPTSGSWVTFSGFTTALSANTQYWIVIENANSTPATNFPTVRFGSANSSTQSVSGGNSAWGWVKKHSTNSGSTWGTTVIGTAGYRIGFSDSSYSGMPMSNIAAGADKAQGTSEAGIIWTEPTGVDLYVKRASMYIASNSSPTGGVQYKIYNGTTLLGTSLTIPAANIISGGSGYYVAPFSSAVQVPAGATIRLTISDTGSNSGANYFRGYEYTWETSAASLALLPFEGTMLKTVYNGTAWDTGGPFTSTLTGGLLLDSTGEFVTGGGPGGTQGPIVIGG